MRLYPPLVCFFVAVSCGALADDAKPLKLPGIFVLGSPGDGFEWKEVRSYEAQGLRGRIYASTKEGSTSRVVLTMTRRPTEDEKQKVATLKAHYNGLVQSLTKGGFKNLRGKQPSLEPPIPSRVNYSISAVDPEGQKVYIGAATVFGKNVYSFQAFARSEEGAAKLLKVAATLKEDEGSKDDGKLVGEELAKLRGTWRQVSSVASGTKLPENRIQHIRIKIDGNKKDVRSGDEIVVVGVVIEIEPSSNPKIWDEKPAGEPGQQLVIRGIYKLEGDTLTRCIAAADEERPAEIVSRAGSGHTLQVFRRVNAGEQAPRIDPKGR